MRGPTLLVFVLILATAGLLATVWEFQLKEPLLGRDTEPFAHKLENVGMSAMVVAVSLIIPLWLIGGADQDRQELIDSLRSAAKVFEHTSDGVMLSDKDGVVLAINPAFTRITGFTAKDALGRNLWVLVSGGDETEINRLTWASVRDRGDWKGELSIQRKSGERIPVLYTFSVVHSETEDTAGYVAVLASPSVTPQPDEIVTVNAQVDAASGSASVIA